jgi:Tfp pilus assembly protein FimT
MGLAAALVMPSISGTLASARFRQGAAEVRAALTQARAQAASTGRDRAVRFDLEQGGYGIPSDNVGRSLPAGVRVAGVTCWGDTAETGVVEVRFFPDGSADEAEIVLVDDGGGRIRLRVDPLTGVVEAES